MGRTLAWIILGLLIGAAAMVCFSVKDGSLEIPKGRPAIFNSLQKAADIE